MLTSQRRIRVKNSVSKRVGLEKPALVANQEQIATVLRQWTEGDASALERLTPLIYGELRRIARFHMSREGPNHTLQPTALINEAFLKIAAISDPNWTSVKHFYRAASKIMRQVLIDYGRKKSCIKRGNNPNGVPLNEAQVCAADGLTAIDLLALNEALEQLEQIDPRKVEVVDLWFFGGRTIDEIASTLDISAATVSRDLEFARVWLARALKDGKPREG